MLASVLGALAAAARAVLAVIKAFWDGLVIIFTHPATFVTVGVLALAAYAGGIRTGLKIDRLLVTKAYESRDTWKAAHNKLLKDAEKADGENREKLAEALKAKAEAEDAARKAADAAATAPPAPPAAEPAGVRPAPKRRAPAPGQDRGGGSGLLWIQSVLWGSQSR